MGTQRRRLSVSTVREDSRAMVRLANAPMFQLDELADRKIVELVGCSERHNLQNIMVLHILLQDEPDWYRIFLDAGIGFFEKYSKEEAFEDFLDVPHIDFGKRWNLIGQTIVSASCIGTDIDDPVLSRFCLSTGVGTVVLRYLNPKDMDSPTLLELRPATTLGSGAVL